MDTQDLAEILDRLLAAGENETVEFKSGNTGFSSHDLGKYFSALSNEANLSGGDRAWLVFGIHNAGYRKKPEWRLAE
ncbi:MAG: ATP-binding protein [Hyphomonadaceae bacterium]|nr:ATP-binding protein [Hyphomonadaceae bacterium]